MKSSKICGNERCAPVPRGQWAQYAHLARFDAENGIGQVVDWRKVDKEDYLLAMERSPIKDVEIKVLLKAALTDDVNSREVFMKGIDHSYYYEGYTTFKAEEL